MSYTESIVKYGDKDSLPSGDSEKRIMGYELQVEFDAIGATFEEMRDENGFLPGSGSGEGIDEGQSEGQITYWDGLKWTATSEVKVEPDLQRVSIGTPAYTSKLFLNGDAYMGMSANFYGQILPTNPDDKPGTFFCGGQSMLGSYIDGQPLTPINAAEERDPSLIRQRAFERDAALDMAMNPVYNAGDPDDPRWAAIRSGMTPTVDWIERNAIVADENGNVVSKGNTQFGNSNDDQHILVGDTYIGYDSASGLPDNNDTVGGTLFLHRGVIVGRGNHGNASIGMENNIIYDLGDPVSDTCAVSKKWVEENSLSSTGDTQLGNSNDDQHVIIGDTYIGYTEAEGKPDNSDAVGGTLFLNRGAIIGRGNTGNAALLMENNIIGGLGNGQYGDHAVNLAQLRASRSEMASEILNAVTKASSFDELKQGLTESLSTFLEMQR